MRNLICTACDSKYGDFFIKHWLKSLRKNVNLENIDILVLDYGFTKSQRKRIDEKNIIRIECERKDHVIIARFNDLSNFLKENKQYDQILMCDGGDIIFQADLKELFETNKTQIRATYDAANILFQHYLNPLYFDAKLLPKFQKMLASKLMINAGVIIGPRAKMQKLTKQCYDLIKYKKHYGPDQLVINYLLYTQGYKELHEKYNCVVLSTKIKYTIKNGVFLDEQNNPIPIMHNAGKSQIFRGVKNFGFGKTKNQLKKTHYLLTNPFRKFSRKFFKE
jgi:hypothetical protein